MKFNKGAKPMKKRLLSAILSLALLLALVPTISTTAFAATNVANNSANALYHLGLFNGIGKDAEGNPIFDLDRAPTRYEAVTMLVRLLGKANEAESQTWVTPFTDVAEWAKPYVGYAYNNGLTSGTSSTTFGGSGIVTVSQYITFVLRALGYDSNTDFEWSKAWELSDKIGLTNGQYNASTPKFTRGDVAIISRNALSCNLKGSDIVLINDLMANGIAVHEHSYLTYGVQTTGHYEQVQVGTKTVEERGTITIWGCRACDFTTTDPKELTRHNGYDFDDPNFEVNPKCFGAGDWWKTYYNQVIGTHEEPIYETQWVFDPATTMVNKCQFCNIEE